MKFLNLWCLPLLFLLITGCASNEPSWPVDQPDPYTGNQTVIALGEEGNGLFQGDIVIKLLSADGSEFIRKAYHQRKSDRSTIKLSVGLKEGIYRLLSATNTASDIDESMEFGLGSRIRVDADGIVVIDNYNRKMGSAGTGSKEDPIIISSSSHLFNLMMAVNDYDYNKYITPQTYFLQVTDIDMKSMSRSCDSEYGWMPIGADTNTPFRGVYKGGGHTISNLIIKRPHTAGVGLFGFMINASVDSLNMRGSSVQGQFAVGSIGGAAISSGDNVRGTVTLTNCTLNDCTVSGNETSAMIGGILGGIDMHAKALIGNCEVSGGSVSGGMAVGGICGGSAIYSMLMVSGCENSMPVKSLESGAGGIVGTADTLMVVGSRNYADIEGPLAKGKSTPGIGTGGIAGGTGFSWITSSVNQGNVKGYEGVGGIVGSTRVKGDEHESLIYNQTMLRYCTNTGHITGTRFVGGAIGEAQAGGFSVGNSGDVSGTSYVGGIVGGSSLAVIHNSLNGGEVKAQEYTGGIVGKCTWGSLAIDQNIGRVISERGCTGGFVGRAGNNTAIHYCANFNQVTSNGGYTGGIVGDIGDPREWTGLDIAECVVGSLECVMGLAGPLLAVAEGSIEMAHAVEIAIKLIESSVEMSLIGADTCLVGFSIDEIINPECEAELEADMKADASSSNDINKSFMTSRRATFNIDTPDVFASDVAAPYSANVTNLADWYCMDGNDEKFNNAMNEKREERAEELEEIAHQSEVKHTVVAGVAVVVSAVSFVAGTVASGGAALPILIASSSAAIIGGVNAIVKSCDKFEKNAVIISQCFNGSHVAGGKAGPMAGRMCDGSLMYSCLNTSPDAGSKEFVAELHKQCTVRSCIDLRDRNDDSSASDNIHSCAFYNSHQHHGYYIENGNFFLSAGDFTDKNSMKYMNISVGEGCPWSFGSKYPYPNKSEMQN